MSLRPPAVAGRFYRADADGLRADISRMIPKNVRPRSCLAVMVPHAGYVYSGGVAAETLAAVVLPRRLILVGPNHTGQGCPVSLMAEGEWATPLGRVPIDGDLARMILQSSPLFRDDPSAHRQEHSLEVQLPLLQEVRQDMTFVPLTLMVQDLKTLLEIGRVLAAAVRQAGEPVLLIASTDMTHYENRVSAEAQDRLALDRILSLDPEGLWETVRKNRISMCGVAPVTAVLAACRALGAQQATLVRYATSGEVTGDDSAVVGYAGVTVA